MPIKVVCQCGQKVNANDKMAGKRVKCPKCGQPLTIPNPEADEGELKLAPEAPAASSPIGGGLLDLLDEANVKKATTGPVCPECGADMKPDAIICLECGYNVAAGEKMSTYVDDEDAEGMSETEKILAKAEREIDETPMTVDDNSFGDGPEAILIAVGALVGAAIIVGIGVGVIYLIDQSDEGSTGFIIMGLGAMMWVVGHIWITVAAFLSNPGVGVGCLLCAPFTVIYAIGKRKSLWMPLMLVVVGFLACIMGNFMVPAPS